MSIPVNSPSFGNDSTSDFTRSAIPLSPAAIAPSIMKPKTVDIQSTGTPLNFSYTCQNNGIAFTKSPARTTSIGAANNWGGGFVLTEATCAIGNPITPIAPFNWTVFPSLPTTCPAWKRPSTNVTPSPTGCPAAG